MGRTGILGGTFNPIHLGHLLIGQAAAEAFGLDKVLLLPCHVSPFKVGSPSLASDADRLEMVRLSATGNPLFEACALDLERGGISYAVDSVQILRDRHPNESFFFIIGMDALRELIHWHRVDEMLKLCEVITVSRPGLAMWEASDSLAFPSDVRDKLLSNVIRGRSLDVSSSEIRRRIAEGKTIRYLVCPEVEHYIRIRGLYVEPEEA